MTAGSQDGPLELGESFLGKYEIRALIGRGGHACVYHGVNHFLGSHVAIKVLHRPGGIDREALRRGQAEAQLLHRLRHENIVQVSDAGVTESGLLYLVMELLEGRNLRQILSEYVRLAIHELLELAAQVAVATHAAHQAGAIHRDLKPENIFVLRENKVKVLDFGIAKITDAAAWTTDKGVAHGTLLYMSPEQLQLHRLGPQSDMFALGLTMYEALLGKHPLRLLIPSTDPSVWEVWHAVTNRRVPALDELDGRIPRAVADIVGRLMMKRPEERFASMEAVARELRECREAYVESAGSRGDKLCLRDLSEPVASTDRVSVGPTPSAPGTIIDGATERIGLAASSDVPTHTKPNPDLAVGTLGPMMTTGAFRERMQSAPSTRKRLTARGVLSVALLAGAGVVGFLALGTPKPPISTVPRAAPSVASAAAASAMIDPPPPADPSLSSGGVAVARSPAFDAVPLTTQNSGGGAPASSARRTGPAARSKVTARGALVVGPAAIEVPSRPADPMEERLQRMEQKAELDEVRAWARSGQAPSAMPSAR